MLPVGLHKELRVAAAECDLTIAKILLSLVITFVQATKAQRDDLLGTTTSRGEC